MPILHYSTGSNVADHKNIDNDQSYLQKAVDSAKPAGWAVAKNIYENGAASKPTAVCTNLSPALAAAVAKKDAVSFTSKAGDAAAGKAYADYAAGATNLDFTYTVSEERVGPASGLCWQGGLPEEDQKTFGCIAAAPMSASPALAGKSSFKIGDNSYTAECTNVGKRTLKGFSTKAQETMWDCEKCPYSSYKPFYEYYGAHDYGDQLVSGALAGVNVDLNGRGMDFSKGDAGHDDARGQVVKKGSAYINAWMYAIREFEDAIDDCIEGDLTANTHSSGPVHAWDEGVGFFVGSQMALGDLSASDLQTLPAKGSMAYSLGNKRCLNFKTCGYQHDSTLGEAYTNIKLMQLFNEGQYKILIGQCEEARAVKDLIVPKMAVPLIQGTIRYTWKMGLVSGVGPKEKAEGATFAAAVLPLVHACDPVAADTIYKHVNLNTPSGFKPDFNEVKQAFESCYETMGITCAEVGGYWNTKLTPPEYYQIGTADASPCVDASTATTVEGGLNGGAVAGIVIGAVLAAIFLILLLWLICKEKAGTPVFYSVDPSKAGAPPAQEVASGAASA